MRSVRTQGEPQTPWWMCLNQPQATSILSGGLPWVLEEIRGAGLLIKCSLELHRCVVVQLCGIEVDTVILIGKGFLVKRDQHHICSKSCTTTSLCGLNEDWADSPALFLSFDIHGNSMEGVILARNWFKPIGRAKIAGFKDWNGNCATATPNAGFNWVSFGRKEAGLSI